MLSRHDDYIPAPGADPVAAPSEPPALVCRWSRIKADLRRLRTDREYRDRVAKALDRGAKRRDAAIRAQILDAPLPRLPGEDA